MRGADLPVRSEEERDVNQALIKLDGVKKVFYTDEVETHALDNINIEINKG